MRLCRPLPPTHRRSILERRSPWGEIPSYCLVEEYLDGPEYAVNVFADGHGKSVVTDLWLYERVRTDGGVVLYSGVRSLDPATAPDISSYALQVCNAVGVKLEAAHVELKLTTRGPVLVEVATTSC